MFSKRIFLSIALFIFIGGLVVFFISKNSPEPSSKLSLPAVTPTPTPAPVSMLTWTDVAGFSFQYPEGTTIDKHPEDTKNYANLTLTLLSKEIINITMSDNTFKNLDAWVGQNSALDTILGGQPAKKILDNGLETVACIDNEVLVKITGKNISGIVKSWTFIYPTTSVTNKKTAPAVDENVLEEE